MLYTKTYREIVLIDDDTVNANIMYIIDKIGIEINAAMSAVFSTFLPLDAYLKVQYSSGASGINNNATELPKTCHNPKSSVGRFLVTIVTKTSPVMSVENRAINCIIPAYAILRLN